MGKESDDQSEEEYAEHCSKPVACWKALFDKQSGRCSLNKAALGWMPGVELGHIRSSSGRQSVLAEK